jgi:DNA-binding HxlR family transcriptional regulator
LKSNDENAAQSMGSLLGLVLRGTSPQLSRLPENTADLRTPAEILHALRQDKQLALLPESQAKLEALVLQMDEDGHERDDPIREVFARLGDKWSTLILLVLRIQPCRYSSLRRLISILVVEGNISKRILTLRLRSLERDGLICRTVIEGKLPAVEYSVTALGSELSDHIETLLTWIRCNAPLIKSARSSYAQRYGDDELIDAD